MESLINQTLKEIEIIAVNDGSSDNCKEILEQYKERDGRIVIIHKENGGVSSARNAGIAIAKGDYIGFVDPDDWINSVMYERLYQLAVTECHEVVMCTYSREFGTHSKMKDYYLPEKVIYCKKEVKSNLLRRLVGPLNQENAHPELLDAWGTVWSKLYKADIIRKNKIRFTDLSEIGTNEDSLFNIEVFCFVQSFAFINQSLYHYWRVNEKSVTSSHKPNLLNQWFTLFSKIQKLLNQHQLSDEYYQALHNRICIGTLGLGLNTLNAGSKITSLEKMNIVRTILNDYRIKRSFKQLELSYFPLVWRAFYFCGKARFSLGFYFLLIVIEKLRKAAK
jgi:glycosyltransferase EpsH